MKCIISVEGMYVYLLVSDFDFDYIYKPISARTVVIAGIAMTCK
jgi:hypothetical protein